MQLTKNRYCIEKIHRASKAVAPLFTLQIAGDLVQGILSGKSHFKMGFGKYILPKEIVQSVGNVGNTWHFLGGNANKTCFMRAVCVYQVCLCFRNKSWE